MRLQIEISVDLFSKLLNVISSCVPHAPDLVIFFTPDEVSICVQPDVSTVGVWAACPASAMFSRYTVISRQQNNLAMRASLATFARCVEFRAEQPQCVVQLTRVENTTMLLCTHQSNDGQQSLEQRVPVTIMNTQAARQFEEPCWEEATRQTIVSCKLPLLDQVAKFCRTAKPVGQLVCITLAPADLEDDEGEAMTMALQVENDAGAVYMIWKKLATDSTETQHPGRADVTVDMRRFAKLMKFASLHPTWQNIYISDRRYARIHFEANIGHGCVRLTALLNGTAR